MKEKNLSVICDKNEQSIDNNFQFKTLHVNLNKNFFFIKNAIAIGNAF